MIAFFHAGDIRTNLDHNAPAFVTENSGENALRVIP